MSFKNTKKNLKKNKIIGNYLKFKINNIISNLKIYLSLLNKKQLEILIKK